MTIVEMSVHMDCQGCETKIRKTLLKLKGVDSVDIDMAKQKVTVTGYVDQKKVLKTVRKTGRRAVLWPYPYISESQIYTNYYYHQYHPAVSQHCIAGTGSSSSYNYNKHGYVDASMYGYYYRPAYSSVIDEKAGSIFSDDNPHGCSIM